MFRIHIQLTKMKLVKQLTMYLYLSTMVNGLRLLDIMDLVNRHLAKLMIGLLFPEEGDVNVFREKLTEENIWDIRSHMGIVFQNPDNQFVGSTVQDDVAFALENNGIPFEEMVKRVHESLETSENERFS